MSRDWRETAANGDIEEPPFCDRCGELLGSEPVAEIVYTDEAAAMQGDTDHHMVHQDCFDPETMEVA